MPRGATFFFAQVCRALSPFLPRFLLLFFSFLFLFFSPVSKADPILSLSLSLSGSAALHNFYRCKWSTEVHVTATRSRVLPRRVYIYIYVYVHPRSTQRRGGKLTRRERGRPRILISEQTATHSFFVARCSYFSIDFRLFTFRILYINIYKIILHVWRFLLKKKEEKKKNNDR